MFNLNNANMENLITQINKERLVNSDTALMMKELYYYVPCEYWYDKQDRLRTDIEGRNTPMYMCECPTVFGCDLFTDEIARGGEIIVPRIVINMFGVLPGDFYSSIGGTGVGDEDFIRKLYGRC